MSSFTFLFTTSVLGTKAHQNSKMSLLNLSDSESLILWCWHVQKGMRDEDVGVDTQLFSLDDVLRYWGKVVTTPSIT